MREKYKLSSNVTIKDIGQYNEENIPQSYRKGFYILNHTSGDRQFLINESIKYYLDKFSPAKSETHVLKLIKAELQTKSKEIEKKCADFFEFLCERNIVVPGAFNENQFTVKTRFKEGDLIDNLKVIKILSESEYLDVYLAADEITNINYVVKFLDGNKTLKKEIYESELKDLENEYGLLKKAKNIPYVCQAHTFKKYKNQYAYIVLEYFESKSLSRFLRKSLIVNLPESLQIIHDFVEAFSLIHKNKLVHGDMHSSNRG